MTHFLTIDDWDSDGIPKKIDCHCERGADHHQLDWVDNALFHWGPDPGHGGLTKHKGLRADCPGPDCGDNEGACCLLAQPHDGPCQWVCNECNGTDICWNCNGDPGDFFDCEVCDGSGHCWQCVNGIEVDA